MPSFDEIERITSKISAIFATLVNFILIILIVTKSPLTLGSYKYLMIYIAFFEMTYGILNFAEQIELITRDSAFLMIVNTRISIFPVVVSKFLNLLFSGFYGITLALLAIHFIYRYLVLSNGKLLKTFQNWKLIVWLLFPIFNSAIWMTVGGVIFQATEDSDRFIKTVYEPLKDNRTLLKDLYYICPYYYPKDQNGVEYINWKSFSGSAILVNLIFLSFATMIFFGSKGYKEMKTLISSTSSSEKYQNIQSQLFKALVFQTIIPVFLMHLPAMAIYSSIFFNMATEVLGRILAITIGMYPALNPLPTIFIVKSYKNALSGCVRCQKPKISSEYEVAVKMASPSQVVPTPQ